MSIIDPNIYFEKLCAAASAFEVSCLLHSNGRGEAFDWIAALGATRVVRVSAGLFTDTGPSALEQLKAMHQDSWLFGWLGYDLKNELCKPEASIQTLSSNLPDPLGFPDLFFFEPAHLYRCKNGEVEILKGGLELPSESLAPPAIKRPAEIKADFSREEYIKTVEKIREHIRQGDVYEVNLCQQFYTEIALDGIQLFRKLNAVSRAPFTAYVHDGPRHLACGSPERYLRKQGRMLLSQPIKGTVGRGTNSEEDRMLMDQLVNSEKDRAENVMIVDLVRNDFARVCKPGTVKVTELFGRHTFEMVHHLISTVEAELEPHHHGSEALATSFPMGSMTGAPKVMALKLIEQYEKTRRGVYSGSVGYISPEGDFDFNVVIRSALYHADKKHLRFPVGGAITWDSVAESEYTETLLKAEGLRKLFV